MMRSVPAASTSRHLDLSPVLATAPLKPGFDRNALSRYGDPSWDLGPAVFRENVRRCHVTVHFGAVEDVSVREALRELLYARLNVVLPGHRKIFLPVVSDRSSTAPDASSSSCVMNSVWSIFAVSTSHFLTAMPAISRPTRLAGRSLSPTCWRFRSISMSIAMIFLPEGYHSSLGPEDLLRAWRAIVKFTRTGHRGFQRRSYRRC